jgi:RNase P subunit RPR2
MSTRETHTNGLRRRDYNLLCNRILEDIFMAEPRIYHGDLKPNDIARVLVAKFNRGNLRVQQVGDEEKTVVQIASREMRVSGGQTALTVAINKVEDGVAVQLGSQAWIGVAASLGQTAMAALINPWNLLGRLDDIAQDIENIKLPDDVWQAVEEAAVAAGASLELSERLRRVVCAYCNTPNPVGEAACIACGAPLGDAQPRTCRNCGFVLRSGEGVCPNCGKKV